MAKKLNPQVGDLIDRFLTTQKSQMTERTWKFYRQYLRSFSKAWGHVAVDKITPSLASEWVMRHYGQCSTSSQFNAARSLTRLFHWAECERLISDYPLKGFRKATPSRRE